MNKDVKNECIDSSADLSLLGAFIKDLDDITDFSERRLANLESDKGITGSFKFKELKMNFIILTTGPVDFINFRLTIEYKRKNLSVKNESEIHEEINDLNKRMIGTKAFLAEITSEAVKVSFNIEYILNSEDKDYHFVTSALNVLAMAPRFFNKRQNKE